MDMGDTRSLPMAHYQVPRCMRNKVITFTLLLRIWCHSIPLYTFTVLEIFLRLFRPFINYQWNANEYGSYFYHCHTRGQIDDGCYGAIHIQASEDVTRPFNTITDDAHELDALTRAERNSHSIILSDWTHLTSAQRWQAEQDADRDSYCTNSILINGKGSAVCLDQATINASMSADMWQITGGIPYTDESAHLSIS